MITGVPDTNNSSVAIGRFSLSLERDHEPSLGAFTEALRYADCADERHVAKPLSEGTRFVGERSAANVRRHGDGPLPTFLLVSRAETAERWIFPMRPPSLLSGPCIALLVPRNPLRRSQSMR